MGIGEISRFLQQPRPQTSTVFINNLHDLSRLRYLQISQIPPPTQRHTQHKALKGEMFVVPTTTSRSRRACWSLDTDIWQCFHFFPWSLKVCWGLERSQIFSLRVRCRRNPLTFPPFDQVVSYKALTHTDDTQPTQRADARSQWAILRCYTVRTNPVSCETLTTMPTPTKQVDQITIG